MKRKIFLAILLMLISGIITSVFALDCWQQLTIDINAALNELAADQSHCDQIADFFAGLCYQEADLNFNLLVDEALDKFEHCIE